MQDKESCFGPNVAAGFDTLYKTQYAASRDGSPD